MIPLFKRLWFALWYDELAARRWARGVLLWAATAGTAVMAVGPEVAATWTAKQWAMRLAFAGLAGAAGMITAGERNQKAPGASE
jgi:hypothetical protein